MNDAFETMKHDIMLACSLTTQEATGFYATNCPICKKQDRKTGGFLFESDTCVFQCFRGSCDATCVYRVGEPVSRKFRRLMESIHVSIPLELRMVKSSFKKALEESLDESLFKKHHYKQINMPDGWVPLHSVSDQKQAFWLDHYDRRAVPTHDILYIEKGTYKGLTAIPAYYYDKLIGFQVVNPKGRVKYITETDNTHMIYVPDRFPGERIIVVEGILDAKCFPMTCAVMRSSITPEQAYFLKGKDVIFLPDRTGNHFIDQVKDYGWKMCVPPWKEKDLNSAVIKYGVMAVAEMIHENTFESYLDIRVRYDLWRQK